MKNIALCTVRYSDNLGDGAISQCLSHIIKKIDPDIKINEFDLAGRTSYGSQKLGTKNRILKIIYRLPYFVGQMAFITMWLLRKKQIIAAWEQSVSENSVLVFGGGQLLMDDCLNFPLKIYSLINYAKSKNCTIAFNAVGVSAKWSFLGSVLFKKALRGDNVVSISVRDTMSYDNLINHLDDSIKSKLSITADPAIYADEVYKTNTNKQKYIGLGVASPMALRANAERPEDFEGIRILEFWRLLALQFVEEGYKPALMTNGSFEDDQFCQILARSLAEHIENGNIIVYARPLNPDVLVSNINDMKIVIAHRLHTNILSYAIGIPSIGLIWDNKMEGFAKATKRSKWFIRSEDLSVENVMKVFRSLPTSVNNKNSTKLKSLAFDSAKKMLKKLFYSC